MKEADVIRTMRMYLEWLFPKTCPTSHRRYATLKEFLQITKHAGSAIPYDVEMDDWNPLHPLGTIACSICPCGNTLCLSSEGMPLTQLWPLLNWARIETRKRGLTPRDLLNHLRDEICVQVLAS